jgi:tetratricopeptide (TPR) repeat protein
MSRWWLLVALSACWINSAFCQIPPPAASSKNKDDSQEAFIFDHVENHIRFEDDGTGLRDTTAVIRIQSEAAIQEFGQLVFGYSSATEKLDVQYVRVRKPDGKVVETSTAGAQDFAPDVLKEAPMYSDYRERHISVASLQAGDVLEYHTVVHVTPLAPHEFWYEHSFPKDAVVREDLLEIDIPKARAVKLKSPDKPYENHDNGDRRIYTWDIKNFKPDRERDREELSEDFRPDVQLSSFTDWQQVAQWYSKLQSDRAAPDDTIRKKAAELTRGATTPEEKTRRLYDYVAQNIRYVSLSFGVGRLQPHQASEVLQNGYGDCKDKHTLLQSLLRAEGVRSYPVLINSFRRLDADVPSPGQFDHLITAVPLGPNFTWLDSTAEVAPYGLILYQLRDKQALLASDDSKGGLVRTPLESPIKNSVTIKMDGSFTETGSFEVKIDLSATGDSDVPLRMAFRQTAQSRWDQLLQVLSRSWGLSGDVSEVHLDPLQETTKPFQLSYRLRQDSFFRVPTSSTDFRLLPPMALPRARDTESKVPTAPIDVGPAAEHIYRAYIRFPANYTVHLPPSVKMSRDYGEYSSSYVLEKNTLQAERRLTLKVSQLPASRRFDYESFRNAAGNETEQLLSATVTAGAGGAEHTASASADTSPAELQKLGVAALQRRDFSAAVDLLKRAVNADAERKDAWDQLGQAYAGLNQHDDAIAAFRKQIGLDQNHKSANSELADELQKEGKFNDAVAAYQKQLEISPYDKKAHENLGLLYVQMKRDKDARAELEAAAAIPPEDPAITAALAEMYDRTGSPDKAASLRSALTGASAATSGSDIFAAALRDDINPDQTIRESRQTLDQIGDQFDSGEYDRLTPAAFSSMNLVALSWSRIGWAKFLQGETLDAMQFLNSAWLLSQSGAVGNRLGRVYEKEGQQEKARHMFALAAAAGGSEAKSSRDEATKLSADSKAADQEIIKASAELLQMRTVKVASAGNKGSAQFALVFETSSKPSRAEFLDGDAALRPAEGKIREKEFTLRFPEISSIKIVRRANLSCEASGCTVVLQPLEGVNDATPPSAAANSHVP